MLLDNIWYHISALASIIADICIIIVSIAAYKRSGFIGFKLFLASALLFFPISIYYYLVGLWRLQIIQWPLDSDWTAIAYRISSCMNIAAQILVVVIVFVFARFFNSRPQQSGKTKNT